MRHAASDNLGPELDRLDRPGDCPCPVRSLNGIADERDGATRAALLMRPRYLFVVARQHPELYELLLERFRDDNKVEVILDRRRETQGRGDSDYSIKDRRQRRSPKDDLSRRSYLVITRLD
jgi:hypothetical protein